MNCKNMRDDIEYCCTGDDVEITEESKIKQRMELKFIVWKKKGKLIRKI